MLASASVAAAPKGADAKAQFDRGVAAFQKGDFQVAIDALGASAALEPDPETLFALAQTERKMERCDLAVVNYEKLLGMNDLPAENRDTVTKLLDECRHILAAKPAEPPNHIDTRPREGRAWYRDPVGDTLLGTGVAGLGVGVGFLVVAAGADSDKQHATTYSAFKTDADRATTDGKIAVAALAGGGGLVVLSILWYATHGGPDRAPVTAWLGAHAGGVAFTTGF